jgi:endonuclease-8
LLFWFAPSRLALHSHMMMRGSWHVYRPGERWRKPERFARIVLDVGDYLAVCFSAPVCELLSASQVAAHPALAHLGPDALDDVPDLAEARRRLDQRADTAIGEALLDQRVLAGIGNVYKSEVLFRHRVNPWTRVGDVPRVTRDALLATAAELLRLNADPAASFRRVTTGDPRRPLAVYGRTGRACPACGAAVRAAPQGVQGRRTYWCPRCQAP